jgi:hypothetical protein
MIEPEHDFKEKPKHQGRTSPVDFVIPLQLEECIYRLENTPASKHLQLTTHLGENLDEPELSILFRTEGSNQIKAQGKLRRWEGTSTRFEGQFTASAWYPSVFILLITVTALYPLPVCVFSAFLLAPLLDDSSDSLGLFMFLMVLWIGLYALIYGLMDYWSDSLAYHDLTEAIKQHLNKQP